MGIRFDKPLAPFRSNSYSNANANTFGKRSRFSSASLRISPSRSSSASSSSALNNNAYILRQIADNCKDFDLQQKIDLEIKMREGTAKLLAACKHTNQSLEAAKSLLTSDLRLAEFKKELQQRKANQRNKLKIDPVFKAKASVSNIRIPLIWKDSDYVKNKGDYRRFAVFCLVKIGTEIYDTIMLNVDRTMTDICFDDTFQFNHVQPDFQFELFIYARILQDDLSMASTPKKLTYKISNSLSRSLGRKMINYKDDFDPETGPKFYLIARAKLTLNDSTDLIKAYDLMIEEDLDKNLQLPLFGHVCCRLAVQPECLLKDYHCGILKMRDNADSIAHHQPNSNNDQNGNGVVVANHYNNNNNNNNHHHHHHHVQPTTETFCWGVLSKFKFNIWHVKPELKDEPAFLKHTIQKRQPDLIIPINSQTKITIIEDLLMFQVINNNDNSNCFTFECINELQLKEWLKCLNKIKEDFDAWEPIAEYNPMTLAPISQHRSQYLTQDRPSGSLYESLPIPDYHKLRRQHSKSMSFSTYTNGYNSLPKPLK